LHAHHATKRLQEVTLGAEVGVDELVEAVVSAKESASKEWESFAEGLAHSGWSALRESETGGVLLNAGKWRLRSESPAAHLHMD
jgi:hypothetical protein